MRYHTQRYIAITGFICGCALIVGGLLRMFIDRVTK